MEKILITGGSGFLGGHLVETAKSIYKIFSTYLTRPSDSKDVSWIKLDLSNFNELSKTIIEINPRFIIHNAAMARVDDCEDRRDTAYAVNILSSGVLAETAKKIGARLIYISTDLIFSGNDPPYLEEDRPSPLSYYGWTKWQGELKVKESTPDHIIVRPGIIFGPPALQGTSFSEWMRNSWLKGESTPLFVDQYRTPLYAGTLARSILELLDQNYTGCLHIAGRERINRYDFGIIFAEHLGLDLVLLKPIKMAELPSKVKRPSDVSLNIDKAKKLLKTKLPDILDGIRMAYPEEYCQ